MQSKFETMKSQHNKKHLAVKENNLTRPTVDFMYNKEMFMDGKI